MDTYWTCHQLKTLTDFNYVSSQHPKQPVQEHIALTNYTCHMKYQKIDFNSINNFDTTLT